MAEKPEDLNLPASVITRMIKEVVSGYKMFYHLIRVIWDVFALNPILYGLFEVRLTYWEGGKTTPV